MVNILLKKLLQHVCVVCALMCVTLSPKAYGDEGGKSAEIPSPFIQVGPFHLCIIKNYEIKGYIRLVIELSCASPAAAASLKYWAPRLQSQYIIDFSEILSQFWVAEEAPDLSRIKIILKRITDNVLGKDKVKDVLFQTYFFADPPPEMGPPQGEESSNSASP